MTVTYNNSLSVESYMHLRKSVGFREVSENQVQKALDRSDYIIAAHVNEHTVGMTRIMTDGLQVLIMDVIVHPDYQGMGIGRSLMEHVLIYIQNMACGDSRILINLLTDSSKIGFYEKFGFIKGEGMRLWLN